MSHRNTYLSVNTDNIINNYNIYKEITKKHVFTVVKANSYGLGSIQIAKVLEQHNTEYLCVATLDEALELREHDIKSPILVMGYINPTELVDAKAADITVSIVSLEHAKQVMIDGLKIHIKVNTSMNRLGHDTLNEVLASIQLLETSNIIEGIYTHYYSGDPINIQKDFDLFNKIVSASNKEFKYIHAASSRSSLTFKEDFTNAVRVGIGLYGGILEYGLKNTASLFSEVINIRQVKANTSIGYDGLYTTVKDTYIATLPIGYADGLLRSDSGNFVAINGSKYPIVGNICMDQVMIEVDEKVSMFDQVEIFGDQVSINDIALKRNTINYEILTTISKRVERVYVNNDLKD